MTEMEQLAAWPKEPLTNEDRRIVKRGLKVGYAAAVIVTVISVGILGAVGFMAVSGAVGIVVLILILGGLAYLVFRLILRVFMKPLKDDLAAEEKIVFEGVLTKISETERSRRDRHGDVNQNDRDYFAEINYTVSFRCDYGQFRRFETSAGKKVKGALLPGSKFLLYMFED